MIGKLAQLTYNVYVKREPNISHNIGSLDSGDIVTIIGSHKNCVRQNMHYVLIVCPNNVIGWVRKCYLNIMYDQ